jgi:hypothetical protein
VAVTSLWRLKHESQSEAVRLFRKWIAANRG